MGAGTAMRRTGDRSVFRDLTGSCQIEKPNKKQVFAETCASGFGAVNHSRLALAQVPPPRARSMSAPPAAVSPPAVFLRTPWLPTAARRAPLQAAQPPAPAWPRPPGPAVVRPAT